MGSKRAMGKVGGGSITMENLVAGMDAARQCNLRWGRAGKELVRWVALPLELARVKIQQGRGKRKGRLGDVWERSHDLSIA
jgi:hypothetical protein